MEPTRIGGEPENAPDSNPNVFIIEDDAALRMELARVLGLSGFDASWFEGSFDKAAATALAVDPDVVVLDLKLPKTDGHRICREIRESSQVPIIVLTSSEDEFDEVLAMNLGADDYVTKPYRPAVLLAHVNSLLRRSAHAANARTARLTHNGVTLDLAASTVSHGDQTAELTHNEHRILQLLMSSPGTVVPRSEIMCALWESDAFIDDNTLTVNISRLRRTLSQIGAPDDYLVTRRGQGYSV